MDPRVDRSDLAMRMLLWEQAQLAADEMRAIIENMVMRGGQTVDTGNVRATYSAGRKSYDYQTAAAKISEATVNLFTIIPLPRTDWRKVCKHVGIDKADIPFTQSEPSVTVKLLS